MTTALTILFAVGVSKWAIAPVIIAAGISALSNLAGMGISSAQQKKAAQQRQAYLDKRQQEEDNWYNRNYYADPTQRADAQRAINMISEELKNRSRATAGRAAMGGATEEAVAQEKALGNQALADVVGDIAAANSARKDAIDAQHHAAQQNIADAELGMQEQEAARRSQNMQTAMASAGSLAAAIAGNTGENDTKPADTGDTTSPVMTPPFNPNAPIKPEGSTNSTTQINKRKPYE